MVWDNGSPPHLHLLGWLEERELINERPESNMEEVHVHQVHARPELSIVANPPGLTLHTQHSCQVHLHALFVELANHSLEFIETGSQGVLYGEITRVLRDLE
jgi:hypothetical protein